MRLKANTLKVTRPELSWQPFMCAILFQAIEDLKSKDTFQALDAMVFLTGQDFPLWAEAVGMPLATFSLDIVPKAQNKIYNFKRRKNKNTLVVNG
ncbi:MAG: hypothetical protein JETCAE01_34480 [Anaerolineaceae bacterium]|nr:MAG: hypothetical protein JETCAE01_34480 [Anaerolineaceae bacterium]